MTAEQFWSPVTPSDDEIVRTLEVLHSDVLHDESALPEAPTPAPAQARAGAREGSCSDAADQAVQQQESAPSDVTDGDGKEGQKTALAAQIRAEFGTPEWWDTDRPSLQKGWEYARKGPWTGDGNVVRTAGCVYAAAVMPMRAVLLYAGIAAGWPHGGSGDVWSDDRPAVAEAWERAMAALRSKDTDDEGPAVDAAGMWLVVSAVVRAVLAAADWTVERPSRFAVAFLLAWLTSLPPF